MRKNALIICGYVLGTGAFSAFFRWLQLQSAFDKDTGLLNPSVLDYLLPLTIIASAVLFYLLCRKFKKLGLEGPSDVSEVFNGMNLLYPVAYYIIMGITVLGGLIALFTVSGLPFKGAYRAIALLGILTGLSFPLICNTKRKLYAPQMIGFLMLLPIIMFTLWLMLCYISSSSSPVLAAYGFEILALTMCIASFMYNAGFAFKKAQPYKALFASMLAAFLLITVIPDSRNIGLQLVMLGCAGMLVLECWMIVVNLKPKAPEPVEPEPETEADETAPESEEQPEPEQPISSTVIEKGKQELMAEPTIQAPDKKARLDDEVDMILDEYNKTREDL